MKRRRAVEREVVVVGGGLVGLMTALLVATETTLDVCVFADDSPEPRTDSQRNHAWLQSGLLYVGSNLLAAGHMYEAGRAMHRQLGFRIPAERGVFRYATEAAAQRFLEHAKGIHLDREVEKLNETSARAALGRFFEPGHANYEVPDCPFDIAGLMNAARNQARAGGATFRVERVQVEAAQDAPAGYRLSTSQELIEPRFAVVCAGSATPAILESLGLPHPLVINRSGLLVLPRADGMNAALLADRTLELSVVKHASVAPHGRLVVGDDGRARVAPADGMTRKLTPAERKKLLSCVPSSVRQRAGDIRATACHKTDYLRADGKTTVEPWVESYERYPGLVFATPGKATMALYTARRILDRLLPSRRSTPGGGQSSQPPPGSEWNETIKTHFHPDFDGMDDTEGEDLDEKNKS